MKGVALALAQAAHIENRCRGAFTAKGCGGGELRRERLALRKLSLNGRFICARARQAHLSSLLDVQGSTPRRALLQRNRVDGRRALSDRAAIEEIPHPKLPSREPSMRL